MNRKERGAGAVGRGEARGGCVNRGAHGKVGERNRAQRAAEVTQQRGGSDGQLVRRERCGASDSEEEVQRLLA